MFSSGIATAKENNGQADIAVVRRATSQYQDVEAARADGYLPASPCEENPQGEGAMGVHFVNMRLIEEGSVDPEQPEALLYEPQPNGNWDLVGVEYLALADEFETKPSLFGVDFHGPHNIEDTPWGDQYDLHVWCWRANPNRMFAPFNPNVSCPDSTHK